MQEVIKFNYSVTEGMIKIPENYKDWYGSVLEVILLRSQSIKSAIKSPRTGWNEQFSRMASHGDDKLLDNPTPTKWDETKWEW